MAAGQTQAPQLHASLRLGIEKALNLELPSATGYFSQAVELDRDDPTGYAFLALSHLLASEMIFDPKERLSHQDSMLSYVDEALTKGQIRIRKNYQDGQAYFAMTIATFVKVSLAIKQKSYLATAHETSHVWEYVQKTKNANPQGYDIYLPMGLLHYHMDQLRGVTRFLSSLFITSGDRDQGLQEILLAAQKGDLLKELAQAELASALIYYEKQPARALPLVLELREKFPRNYNFSFVLATAYSALHKFEDAFSIAKELEKAIQSGKPPFVPQLQPRYDNLMGRIFFDQGEYVKAEEYFQMVLKENAPYNTRNRVAALLRLGMIYDARKQRKQATECYSRILETEDAEGISRVEAKKYLSSPYVPPP